MAKSLITAVLSVLRWAHWLVKCAVVYPLAMMMLLVVLVFRTGPYTFGQTLVKTVESVQQEGYVIQDCTGPKELNSDAVNAPLPPLLQEDCTTVITDAAGYAAYIDQSYTHNILWLWLLMAVVFTGSLWFSVGLLSAGDHTEKRCCRRRVCFGFFRADSSPI